MRYTLMPLLAAALMLGGCAAATSAPKPDERPLAKKTTTRLTTVPQRGLHTGKPVTVDTKLTRTTDLSRVLPTELKEGALNLLLIDNSFTDYRYITATHSSLPGLYSFEFTPGKAATYRLWADVSLTDEKFRQFPFSDLGERAAGLFPRTEALTATQDKATYELHLSEPLEKNDTSTLSVKRGEQELPVLTVAGFHDDYRTVLFERSATVRPAKEGFIRLFVTVEDGGKQRTLPFTANIVK